MTTPANSNIYDQFGVQPIINASGSQTILGGSIVSDRVSAAIEASSHAFVDMEDLLDKTGASIAGLLGAEDACVTSGCFAALVMSAAAAMTINDRDKIGQLPDTAGLKDEFLIQKKMRYHYDRCVSVPGGKLVEVGNDQETTVAHVEAAIGPRTAGFLLLARDEEEPGTLSIAEAAAVAEKHGIALILDAAGEIYPLDRMRGLPSSGAALVCYGAKYIGSVHSSGILCGKREYVQAAKLSGFIAFETEGSPGYESSIGRGYKIDRQEIIGTAVALEEWLALDHEERLQEQARRIETISSQLGDTPHVEAANTWGSDREPWMRLRLTLDTAALGRTAADVEQELRNGEPSIWVRPSSDDVIMLTVHTLKPGEAEIVGERLRQALSNRRE